MKQENLYQSISPLFICLGFPKCATTWIHRQLEVHPEVGCTTTKEVTYWTKNYDQGPDWYLRHFPTDKPYKRYAEVTPHYVNLESIKRLAENLEGLDVRFMVCLRDPCDRTYSHYQDVLRAGRTVGDFASAVNEIPELLHQSQYGARLDEFLEYFSKESLHIGYYEDIKSDPLRFVGDIYRFIGVDDSFVPSDLQALVNPGRKANRFDIVLKKLEMSAKGLGLKREHLVKLGVFKYVDALNRKLAASRPLPKLEANDLAFIKSVLAEDLGRQEALGIQAGTRWPKSKSD